MTRRRAYCTFSTGPLSAQIEPLEPRTLFAAGIGAIDAKNLGKGDWIWEMGSVETNLGVSTVQGVIDKEKAAGMDWLTVKCGDGNSIWSQFTADLVTRAHEAGLKIFGWAYMYGGYQSSDSVSGEVAVAKNALDLGADGFICDAESEYEHVGSTPVTQFFNGKTGTGAFSGILASYPNSFYAYAPFPYVSLHSAYPYKTFSDFCDVAMPQDYWATIGVTPTKMVTDMDTNWKNLYAGFTTVEKLPIAPIGQGYSPATSSDITTFVNALKNDTQTFTSKYQGVSYWSAQHETSAMRTTITNADIGSPAPEFKIGDTVYVTASGLNAWSDKTSAPPATAVVKSQNTLATIESNGPASYVSGFDRYQLRYLGDTTDTFSANYYLAAVPSAPTTPAITSPANNSLTTNTSPTINWTDSQYASSYDVYLDGVLQQNISATTSQLALSGLSYVNHTWQIKARNSKGTTASSVFSFGVVPLAPTGLSATDGTTSSAIRLAWAATTGATTYAVYRNSSNDSSTAPQIGTSSTATYDDSAAADGTIYFYWVKALNGSAQAGAFSASDSGFLDATPPAVLSSAYNDDAQPLKITVQFSEDVQLPLGANAVSIQDENDSNQPPFSPTGFTYDSPTKTATFTFAEPANHSNYRATLAAGNARDNANNAMSTDFTIDFYTLAADGNHNRTVDLQDFNLLAAHFGKSGQTFSQGNYDYSADGTVSITDFNILAANFGKSMPAPTAPTSPQSLTDSFSASPTKTSAIVSTTPEVASNNSDKAQGRRHLLQDSGLL
jgi:hypothetical protein